MQPRNPKANAIEMCTKEWLPEERAAARFI
jgi:hypothetical protein